MIIKSIVVIDGKEVEVKNWKTKRHLQKVLTKGFFLTETT